jgi:hypothetical protein
MLYSTAPTRGVRARVRLWRLPLPAFGLAVLMRSATAYCNVYNKPVTQI